MVKIATEVYDKLEVKLLDGQEVELLPLSIKNLRKFMKMWNDHMNNMNEVLNTKSDNADIPALTEIDVTEMQFDVWIKMCALCLPQLKGTHTDAKFIAYLEDVLDEKTVYKVLDVCGGLRLNTDPNLNPAQMPGNLADGIN